MQSSKRHRVQLNPDVFENTMLGKPEVEESPTFMCNPLN
jgi:hypothetical protein